MEHTEIQEVEERVAEQLAEVHRQWYGQGPKRARAYYTPGHVLVVLLHETFTQAERRLIAHDRGQHIQENRRQFQMLAKDEFVAIAEQATGQQVQAFISNTDLGSQISVEVFVMSGIDRTDMADFEAEAEGAQPPPSPG